MDTTTTSIDLRAPGAIEDLLAFHRAAFGTARMMADDDGTTSQDADDTGDSGSRGDGGGHEAEQDDDERLRAAGKRALDAERAAKREATKKANEERAAREAAESRLAELEREKMSAQERAEAERDEWRKKFEQQAAERAALELEVMRRDVAGEKGLTARQARRLRGSTREELEQDADELIRDFGVDKGSETRDEGDAEKKPRSPRPDRSAGAGATGKSTSVSQITANYLATRGNAGAAGGSNT